MSRIAVVTGARRGIGYAIAEALERDGYTVVYSARSEQGPEGKLYIPCDINSSKARKALLDEVISRFGEVHLLVNNAGIAPPERLDILETTEENYNAVVDTNLRGTFFMCQLFACQMTAQSAPYECRIINTSSISAYTASTNRGEYCISKAGISMVTSLFASRLSEYGISVFEVRPGIIQTDMTAGVQSKYEQLIEGGLTPIKRMGLPQDVADCVSALASGKLDFATGQVINADGGFHLRRL